MRVIAVLLCMVAVQGLVLVADPKDSKKQEAKQEKAAPPGPKYDDKAFAEAWGTEWKHGEVPSWKETYPKAALPYEDHQSDGKLSTLQVQQDPKEATKEDKEKKTDEKEEEGAKKAEEKTEAADAEAKTEEKKEPKAEATEDKDVADKSTGPGYGKEAWKEDWHREWKQGEVPSWKETYPKAALPYEDRQSDGKPGLIQVEQDPKEAKKEEKEEEKNGKDEEAAKKEEEEEQKEEKGSADAEDAEAKEEEKEEPKEAVAEEKDAPKPKAEAAEEKDAADKSTGPGYGKEAWKEDWHREWKQGEVPSWKETYPKAALPYEDRQSDGKPGLMQVEQDPKEAKQDEEEPKEKEEEEQAKTDEKEAKPEEEKAEKEDAAEEPEEQKDEEKTEKEDAADTKSGPTYGKKEWKKDWHREWKQGEVPSWKETYPKAALPYEDRQSDGKPGFVQVHADPKKAKKEEKKTEAANKAPGPVYDDKAFAKAWGREWKQGEVPSWKETYPKAALPYEDRQSDGKKGNFVQVHADPKEAKKEQKPEEAKKTPGPVYDDKAFAKAWGREWKQGEVPSWKETYPKAALPYEDRQSDGKKGNFLQAKK